jgi:hypothetical protein
MKIYNEQDICSNVKNWGNSRLNVIDEEGIHKMVWVANAWAILKAF